MSSAFLVSLIQLPGIQGPDLPLTERIQQLWQDGGWMMWPLLLCALVGLGVIIWKLGHLTTTAMRTRGTLKAVDSLVAEGRLAEAIREADSSRTPAGRILAEGLRRHEEGPERVAKAIESTGVIEMAKLERGLIILATVSTVGPLLGFLGTVVGMIQAFQAIELAGEVEATTVAGGIKVALITTAAGLLIAIPVSVFHNYFVAKIDALVIDMEESAQRTIDHLHDMEPGRSGRLS